MKHEMVHTKAVFPINPVCCNVKLMVLLYYLSRKKLFLEDAR
jgi:hypothetical protein